MITLGLSLLASLSVFFLVFSFFGIIGALLPAIAVLLLAYFLISKNLSQKLQIEMTNLQNELNKGKFEEAISHLKKIKKSFGPWQFFVSSTIDGQIGIIYYLKNQHTRAKAYLEKSFVRHWVAKAMLGVIYYKERKMDQCDKVFSYTTKMVKKSGLLWSVWAYCHWRNGHIDRALNILSNGESHLKGADPQLKSNILMLQNDKRMKMKGYGEQWYQFQLELSPGQTQMKQGRVRFKAR